MIAIVDYNAGNLRSVKRACDAVGLDAVFTQDPELVLRAERVIFPGVGHARTCMETLERTGLGAAITQAFKRGTPVLGICVGAQLVLDGSDEGPTRGLGLIHGQTRLLKTGDARLKVPHIGWNELRIEQKHPLLAGLANNDEVYFVHSYYLDPADSRHVYATTDHGPRICVAVGRDNLFATQFHPEKSGPLGLDLLARFARWEGTPC
jgi:glutamine amidotransferase